MIGTDVVLGSVLLRGFEIPKSIRIGGSQRLQIHKLAGGDRVVDLCGSDDGDVIWSGVMLGDDASDRARAIDAMRQSGDVVPLLFGDAAYDVLVRKFEADYRNPSWIGQYRVQCLILPPFLAQEPGVLTQLLQDLSFVLGLDPDGVVSGLQAAVAGVQSQLLAVSDLMTGSPGYGSVTSAINTALSVVSFAGHEAEAQLLSGMNSSNSSDLGGTAGLVQIARNSEILAKSSAASGLMNSSAISMQGEVE